MHFFSFLFLYFTVCSSQAAADMDTAGTCDCISTLGSFRFMLSQNTFDNSTAVAFLETTLGVPIGNITPKDGEGDQYCCFFIPPNLDDTVEGFLVYPERGLTSKIRSTECLTGFRNFLNNHPDFLRNWASFLNSPAAYVPARLPPLPLLEHKHFRATAELHVQNIITFLSQIHIEDMPNFLQKKTISCIQKVGEKKRFSFLSDMQTIREYLLDQTLETDMCAVLDVRARIDLIAQKLKQATPYFRPFIVLEVLESIRMPAPQESAPLDIAGIGLAKGGRYAPFTDASNNRRKLTTPDMHMNVTVSNIWKNILDELGKVHVISKDIRNSVDMLCFLHDVNVRSFRRMLELERAKQYDRAKAIDPYYTNFVEPIIALFKQEKFENPMLKEYIIGAFSLFAPPHAPYEGPTIEELVDAAKALSMEYAPYATEAVSKRRNLLRGSSLSSFIAEAVPLYNKEMQGPDYHQPWIIKILYTAKTRGVCLPRELMSELSPEIIAHLEKILASVKNFACYAGKRSVADILLDDLSPANLLNIIEQSIANAHVCLHDTALAYMSALTEASRSSLRDSTVLIKVESMDNLRGWVCSFYDLALHGAINHARIDKLLQKIDEIAKRLGCQRMLPLALQWNWIYDESIPAIPRSANEFNQLNGVERASIMTMFEKNIPLLDSIEAQILAVSAPTTTRR